MNKIAELRRIYDNRNSNNEALRLTQEDLSTIKQDAYTKGVAEGQASANLEKLHKEEMLQKELIFNISAALDKCLEEEQKLINQLSDLIFNVAMNLFEKTFTTCNQKLELEEVSNFVREHLALLGEMPSLTITVHPDFQKSIEEQSKNYLAGKLTKTVMLVNSNPDFFATDCVISWESGHLEKKLYNIIETLKTTVSANTSEGHNVVEG